MERGEKSYPIPPWKSQGEGWCAKSKEMVRMAGIDAGPDSERRTGKPGGGEDGGAAARP